MADTYTVGFSGMPTIDKDPDAVLDYPFDWSDYLAPIADTIVSAVFVVDGTPGGLVVVSSSNDATSATAIVSGGVLGQRERLTCRITTAGGRVDDRSVYLRIKER